MDARYLYLAPTGVRTGPYTAAELAQLAAVGGIDLSGSIEEEGTANRWAVVDIPWLREAVERARLRATPRDPNPVPSQDESLGAPPPPAAPFSATASAAGFPPPRPTSAVPPTVQPPPDRGEADGFSPLCSRTNFILLALLPSVLGVVGVHNVVAGYSSRGILQLILSGLSLLGFLAVGVGIPCCCLSLPLSVGLFVWAAIEAATITTDAMGRPFRP